MVTLAQQLGNLQQQLDVPDPNPLPSPPAWEVHLLEEPLMPAVIIGLVGVIVLAWLWSRGDAKRATLIGGGIVVLAGVWYAIGALVTTQRERVDAAARALVLAVAKADRAQLDAGLDPSAKLTIFLAPGGVDKDGIMRLVEQQLGASGRFKVTGLTVEEVQRRVDDSGSARTAQVQIKVRVSTSAIDVPNRSWWRLDYAQGPEGEWRATGILPLAIQWVADPSGR